MPTYVRTLWRPNTKATLRLQGCTKPAQLVSMVTYSPLRAQKRIGEWSKGWPASCRTEGHGKQGAGQWEGGLSEVESPQPRETQPQEQPQGSPGDSWKRDQEERNSLFL